MTERTTPDKGRTMPGQGLRHAALAPDGHGQPSLEAVRLSGQAGAPKVNQGLKSTGSTDPSPVEMLSKRAFALAWAWPQADSSSLLNVPAMQKTRRGESDGSWSAQRRLAGVGSGEGLRTFPRHPQGAPNLFAAQVATISLIARHSGKTLRPTVRQSLRRDGALRSILRMRWVPLRGAPVAGNMDPVFSLAADFFKAVSEGLRHER